MNINLNERITVTMPEGTISEPGCALIRRYINDQNLRSAEWVALNPDTSWSYLVALPETWSWSWLVQRGDFRGTFPRRVSAYYHLRQSLKCPPAFLSELGNIARAHSAEPDTFEIEFVDTFDWTAGAFGDSSSCFWGGRKNAIPTIQRNGGLAVRLYRNNQGFARAWIAPLADTLIIFNGYGFSDDASLRIVQIVALHMGLQYKLIGLANYGTSNGTLYINGGRGFLLGSAESIAAGVHHDLQWAIHNSNLQPLADDPEAEEDDRDICHECGERIEEDAVYWGVGDYHTYCEHCYYEYFTTCDWCNETVWNDNVMEVWNVGSVCEGCYSNHVFMYCDSCGIAYEPESDQNAKCPNCHP